MQVTITINIDSDDKLSKLINLISPESTTVAVPSEKKNTKTKTKQTKETEKTSEPVEPAPVAEPATEPVVEQVKEEIKTDVAPTTESVETTPVAEVEEVKPLSKEDCKAALTAYISANGMPKAREKMAELGYETLSAIPESKRKKFIEDLGV